MKKSLGRRAIAVSVIFHVALLLILLFWYVERPGQPKRTAELQSVPSEQAADSVEASAPVPRSPPAAPPMESVEDEQVRSSLEAQMEQVRRLPDERKLTELEKNLKRLESVADPNSVIDVTETIAGSLGLESDRYNQQHEQSAGEGAAGEFDTDTSQISGVTRKQGDNGQWRYEARMVDDQGRTLTVPLGVTEGEKLYDTFQLIERYPMAEGIYRSVVMPMMQEMLQSDSTARPEEPFVIAPEADENGSADSDEDDAE